MSGRVVWAHLGRDRLIPAMLRAVVSIVHWRNVNLGVDNCNFASHCRSLKVCFFLSLVKSSLALSD